MQPIQKEGLPEIAKQIREKKSVVVIIFGIVITAILVLFCFHKAEKKVESTVEETYRLPEEKKPEAIAAVIPPPVLSKPEITEEQIALIQAKRNELQQRLNAPLMIVNNSNHAVTQSSTSQTSTVSDNSNMQFMNQVSSQAVEKVTAMQLQNMPYLIAQGRLIHAVLEPATQSDLPGFIRAIVSDASYSEDGSRVLIPQGSRLIGQYQSGMLQGQSRIFLVWTRVITPAGVSIQLGSPGIDSLGVTGLGADEINTHFWERFGNGSLLSLLSAGAANVGVKSTDNENSAALYRSAVAGSFAQSAGQSLQQNGNIPPTLKTYQGKPIIVFVAKDLDFSNVNQMTHARMQLI